MNQPTTATPLTADRAQDFVERFAAAWREPTPDKLSSLVHLNTTNDYPGVRDVRGREGVRAYMESILTAVPSLRLRVTRWAHKERDVFIEWVGSATVDGTSLEWMGVDVVTLDGDREIASTIVFDTAPLTALLARSAS